MKHLADALYSKFLHLCHLAAERIAIYRRLNSSAADLSEIKPEKITPAETQRFKKASLFVDGKTNVAALSLVLRGVAEVLSQKMDLPWKAEASRTLNYEKEAQHGQGKICYYVTDNPENPHPETLAEEAALAVIDKFDPRACAIHLIYCALVANLDKPWEGNFVINDKELLEYTGLVKRRDLCKHEQLSILYQLLRQPAQILACIAWPINPFRLASTKTPNNPVIRNPNLSASALPRRSSISSSSALTSMKSAIASHSPSSNCCPKRVVTRERFVTCRTSIHSSVFTSQEPGTGVSVPVNS